MFNQLFGASAEFLKTLKKPLVRSKIQRQIQSAKDWALEKILVAADEIKNELTSNLEKMNLQKITDAYVEIEDQKKIINTMQELYKSLFGEELKVEYDIETSPFKFEIAE